MTTSLECATLWWHALDSENSLSLPRLPTPSRRPDRHSDRVRSIGLPTILVHELLPNHDGEVFAEEREADHRPDGLGLEFALVAPFQSSPHRYVLRSLSKPDDVRDRSNRPVGVLVRRVVLGVDRSPNHLHLRGRIHINHHGRLLRTGEVNIPPPVELRLVQQPVELLRSIEDRSARPLEDIGSFIPFIGRDSGLAEIVPVAVQEPELGLLSREHTVALKQERDSGSEGLYVVAVDLRLPHNSFQ